jgi:hypothetical protein
MRAVIAFDETAGPGGCLLWRIRGVDRALYAMFLRRIDTTWSLDLHRDGAQFASYQHATRDRAMRDARHVFVMCQVPQGARWWECTGWDGRSITVHIEHCEAIDQ